MVGCYVRRDEDNKGVVDITRPDVWYPVVDGANIRKVLYHVLATQYISNGRDYIRVEIHDKGVVEIRDYLLKDGNKIGALIGTPRREQTGLPDFAIVPVHNLLPSDRVFGIDDYVDIQSLVCEVEVRLAQIAKVPTGIPIRRCKDQRMHC